MFILDNFQRNFFDYHESKGTDYTVLTQRAIESIRELAEDRDNGIHFVVSYRYPPDVLLNTDWYLNNLRSLDVGLLTDTESRDLVMRVRTQEGLPVTDELMERILYFGGRHPYLLNEAAHTSFPDGERELRRWNERHYRAIKDYLAKCDGDEEISMGVLRSVAGGDPGALDQAGSHLAEKYCYRARNDDHDGRRVFSEHFAQSLTADSGHGESEPDDEDGPGEGPPAQEFQFDAFVSYNGNQDTSAAQRIAGKLRERGLKPWFDQEQIRAGGDWQREMAKGIRASKTMVILIGTAGLGHWHKKEMQLVLRRRDKEGMPIIPVLLPGVARIPEDESEDELLDYLRLLSPARFEKSLNEADPFDAIVAAIQAEKEE